MAETFTIPANHSSPLCFNKAFCAAGCFALFCTMILSSSFKPFTGFVPANVASVNSILKNKQGAIRMATGNHTNKVTSTTGSPQFVTGNGAQVRCLLFTQRSQSVEVEQGNSQSLLEYLVTSDAVPVSARLNAADTNGKVPGWLSVNRKPLKGLAYTTGSEISFDFNATGLPAGKYLAKVTASSPGYNNAVLEIRLTVK